MNLQTLSKILTLASYCIAVAMVVQVIASVLKGEEKTLIRSMKATVVLAVLLLFVVVGNGLVARNLLPECPNCEKRVSSAYCPGCGWESGLDNVSICPTCGAEWNAPFCGDCGSSMDLDT